MIGRIETNTIKADNAAVLITTRSGGVRPSWVRNSLAVSAY
ncbi:MAG: hypothetical protein RXQ00_07125 [Caldivirga sp.]